MGRKRKYPKTQGYYVYVHITPEKDCYFGMSRMQPSKRWHPSLYKNKSLKTYIEQFGWENIEHRVLFDNLTKRQAEILEDWFIVNAKRDGFCINKQGSGGIYRDNRKEYERNRTVQYYQNDPEYRERRREYQREYQRNNKEHQREYQRDRYQNSPEYRAKVKERQRKYRLKKKLDKNS